MKKYNRNESVNIGEVKDLIIEIISHPDSPYWLKDAVWHSINDHSSIDAFDPVNVRSMMEFTNWNDTERGEK